MNATIEALFVSLKNDNMINQVTLVGRIGSEPIFNVFGDSCNLRVRIATWRNVKDATHESGWKQITQWHSVVVWNKQAEASRKLSIGDMVAVTGELRSREYEDKDDIKRIAFEVVGNIKRISTKRHDPKPETTIPDLPPEFGGGDPPAPFDFQDGTIDDLPF